jgi:DNA-binding HxlR family transcriptional regulator
MASLLAQAGSPILVGVTLHPARPPRVEYQLARLGRSLLKPIRQFLNWTVKVFPDIQRAREVFDKASTPSTHVKE